MGPSDSYKGLHGCSGLCLHGSCPICTGVVCCHGEQGASTWPRADRGALADLGYARTGVKGASPPYQCSVL